MRLISMLFRRFATHGRLELKGNDGFHEVYGGKLPGPDIVVRISDNKAALKAALRQELWLAEAYMDGTLTLERGSIHDLMSMMTNKGGATTAAGEIPTWRKIMRRYIKLMYLLPTFSVAGSDVQNYDKGHTFFREFLDSGMLFSCAYWTEGVESLEDAQAAKLRHIAAKLCLLPDHRVLDIGCGWGGLSIYLASIAKVRVTGVTLAEDQLEIAKARAEILGLSDRVEFRLQDYNDVTEKFDRVVSVAMLEHVGRKNLDGYFANVRERLSPDGLALIHSITSKAPPARSGSFITKYFDPNGCAPSLSETFTSIEKTGLWTLDCEILRLHYARTLEEWRIRFEESRDTIAHEHGEKFTRMWEFYLSICQCAFEYGQSCVFQIQLGADRDAAPITRNYIEETSNIYAEREAAQGNAMNRSLAQAIEAASI